MLERQSGFRLDGDEWRVVAMWSDVWRGSFIEDKMMGEL